MLIEPILSQIESSAGKKGQRIVSVVLTIFLFILFSNLLGLFPAMASPTADINTTLGMALMVIALVHIYGLADRGMHYVAHFFKPNPAFVLLHIMDNVYKTDHYGLSSLRQHHSHEILMIVLMGLIPFIVPSGILFLGLFIGVIQAAIFTILSHYLYGRGFGGRTLIGAKAFMDVLWYQFIKERGIPFL